MNIVFENLILDVPILFSVFMFTLNGWKKGVVKPFMNFVGGLIAFSLSGIISFYLSSYIHNHFLRNIIISYFDKICSRGSIELFPKYLITFLNFCGANRSKVSDLILQSDHSEVLFDIVSPVTLNFLRIVLGTFFFGIVIAISRKITKGSLHIFSAPVLSQFNSLLGAFLGILKGIILVWGCILFLKISLIYWNNPPKIFSQESIRCTSVFVKFYDFNPITNDIFSYIPFPKKIYNG